MPDQAWPHYASWTERDYADYRVYVQSEGYKLRGRTEDCADICMSVLIDFAAMKGLPLTFKDLRGSLFMSKTDRIVDVFHDDAKWYSKETYCDAVKKFVGAKSLFIYNTEVNPEGPKPGDLMANETHTALVLAAYGKGLPHPQRNDQSIPIFPGPDAAAKQIDVLTYFFNEDARLVGPLGPTVHFDYLNHRGEGIPRKQKAEIILFADRNDPYFKKFYFEMWSSDVLSWGPEFDAKRISSGTRQANLPARR